MSKIATIPASTKQVIPIQNVYEFLYFKNPVGLTAGTNVLIELSYKGSTRIAVRSNEAMKAIAGITAFNLVEAGTVEPFSNLVQTAVGGTGSVQGELIVDNQDAVNEVEVYGFSTSKNEGSICRYDLSSVVANSNELYTGFEMLSFNLDFDSAQIRFADGWEDRFNSDEVFALMSQLAHNQNIDSLNILDNRAGIIESIRIYTAGTAVNVIAKTFEEL